jgi:hypothetical protein
MTRTEIIPKKQWSLSGQFSLPSPRGQLPIIMRLHPGAGVIISWKPDCSPQVMTAVITSPESSENQN